MQVGLVYDVGGAFEILRESHILCGLRRENVSKCKKTHKVVWLKISQKKESPADRMNVKKP